MNRIVETLLEDQVPLDNFGEFFYEHSDLDPADDALRNKVLGRVKHYGFTSDVGDVNKVNLHKFNEVDSNCSVFVCVRQGNARSGKSKIPVFNVNLHNSGGGSVPEEIAGMLIDEAKSLIDDLRLIFVEATDERAPKPYDPFDL